MSKVGLAVLFCLCFSVGFAQSSGPSIKASKPVEQESGFMSWVHDAWKTVQDQGKPAAERIVKQFPKRFKAIKQQVADLSKTVHDKVLAMDLEQKKNLVIELWRVRKSIDLLTLLQPEVLHSLTGLDTAGLATLENTVLRLTSVVQAEISAHR